MATTVSLMDVDPAACARLRELIVGKDGQPGAFQKHMPKAVLERWVRDEFDQDEVQRILFANAEALVAQIRSDEGLPKHEDGEY